MSSGVKISELTAASTFTGSESFPLVQSSTTLKGTADQMTTYVAAATATLLNKTLSGTFNTFTNIPLSSAVTGTLPVANGGTGVATYAVGDLLYATATTTLAKLAATATTFVLLSGTAPSWGKVNVASAVTGTLSILNGGTGATTATTALANILSNAPLPIANGGTGAATAINAVVNLSVNGVVTTLAALKALTVRPSTVTNQYLSATGDRGGGTWDWGSGDYTAFVTADTGGNFWAAPSSDPTGASGVWRRNVGYVNTADADAQVWAYSQSGTHVTVVEGNYNGYIGVVVNNLSAAATAFPTAITGVAYQKGTGNVAYAAYLENILSAAGIVTAEFAAFQKSAPAPNAYPFTDSLGTSQHISKSLQLTAGTTSLTFTGTTTTGSTTIACAGAATTGSVLSGTGIARNTRITGTTTSPVGITVSKAATATNASVSITALYPAAAALDILREGTTSGQFNFGITSRADSILSYLCYFDATSTQGSDNGIYLAIPGDVSGNSHLILKTMSAGVSTNKVVDVQNSSGTTNFSVTQAGDVAANIVNAASKYQVAGVDLATMSGTYALYKAGDGSTILTAGGSGDQSSYYDNTQHVFRAIAGASNFATIDTNGLTIASGKALKLGNAYVATPPTCTGYVTLKDSAGTTYKVLVGT